MDHYGTMKITNGNQCYCKLTFYKVCARVCVCVCVCVCACMRACVLVHACVCVHVL